MRKTRVAVAVAAALAWTLVAVPSAHAQRGVSIQVDRPDVLWDIPVHIEVDRLAPRQPVTIGARAADSQGRVWQSAADFVANGRGEVDLAEVAPRTGSYSGVDAMGLLWSMKSEEVTAGFFVPADRTGVTLTVATAGTTVAQRTIVRRLVVPGLTKTPLTVAETGLSGIMFHPPPTLVPRQAILVFGGSGGGLSVTTRASLLASHGYPTLALAYFKAEGLPEILKDIPLEYFGAALQYLRRQPGVDPDRITTYGISRGSEAAQLLGVHYPELVSGVIALVPSNVALCSYPGCAGPAWTWRGQPVPFTRQFNNPNPTDDPAAVIPVERIRGPVFLNCGGVDPTWVSCRFGAAITARLEAHQSPYRHVSLSYPGGGHGVGTVVPYLPAAVHDGATPEANERSREHGWPRLLDFIRRLPR